MKTKKHGVFAALAAVLLIAAALIASCVDPETLNGSSASSNENTGNFVPPAGKSYIKLNLGGSAGRTIMPTAPGLSLFSNYTVNIKAGGTSISGYPKTEQSKAQIDAIDETVTAGTSYTIEIDAYIGTGSSAYLAASGTKTITAGPGANNVPIALVSTNPSGNGLFTWDLSYAGNDNGFDSADLTSATLKLSSTVGGTSILNSNADIDLLTDNSGEGTGSENVPSGVYYVTVSLAKTGSTPVIFTDVVHIYRDMTTTFGKIFTALVAAPTYNVVFHNADNEGSDSGNISYAHGETIVDGANYPGIYPVVLDAASALPSGNKSRGFMGWYKTASASEEGGTVRVELDQKVFKAYTLYARWYSIPKLVVQTLTFDIDDVGTELAVDEDNSETTISRSQLDSGNSAVIKMDITGIDGASDPKFIVYGEEFSGNTLTIKYGGTPNIDDILVDGSFQILMIVTVGGKEYGKFVTFTISD